MSDVKILSQKKVFKAELFDVFETKVLENGRTRIHHNIERKPTILVLALTNSYELYLVSQYRYLWEKNTLEAIAGFVEKGESPLEAAKRELKEETGIRANHWEELFRVRTNASVIKSLIHVFLAKDLELGEKTEKRIEIIKMPLEEAVGKVASGEINIASSVVGILLLYRLKKEKKL